MSAKIGKVGNWAEKYGKIEKYVWEKREKWKEKKRHEGLPFMSLLIFGKSG